MIKGGIEFNKLLSWKFFCPVWREGGREVAGGRERAERREGGRGLEGAPLLYLSHHECRKTIQPA